MKHYFLPLIFLFLVFSCKKDSIYNGATSSEHVHKLQRLLRDSLSLSDYNSLDFSKVARTKIGNDTVLFWRIPFLNKRVSSDFVLLQTDTKTNIRNGKIIHLTLPSLDKEIESLQRLNGSITISSLNGKQSSFYQIIDGYMIKKPLNKSTQKQAPSVVPGDPPGTWLPEIVLISHHPRDGGGSIFSTWYSLPGLMGVGGSGNGSNNYTHAEPDYYSDHGGSGGGSGTGSSNSPRGGQRPTPPLVYEDETIEVEIDYQKDAPFISAAKIFKCFDAVPTVGATYSITLCADVPVNAYPTMAVNTGSSAGHAFVVVRKQNGTKSVTQAFGFYPAQTPSLFNPFSPVAGGIKDNGGQEINASIQMSMNATQFGIIKQKAISWSTGKYILAEYNCSNYAIDIFNSVRPQPLQIAPLNMAAPGNTNAYSPTAPITIEINKSPQMLFARLQQIKKEGGAEASRILINQSHNYRSPISKGECN